MKNKLFISSLMIFCWIVSIVFWFVTIYFLIKNNQNLFWYSAFVSFIFCFFSKKLLKVRKELDVKIS